MCVSDIIFGFFLMKSNVPCFDDRGVPRSTEIKLSKFLGSAQKWFTNQPGRCDKFVRSDRMRSPTNVYITSTVRRKAADERNIQLVAPLCVAHRTCLRG